MQFITLYIGYVIPFKKIPSGNILIQKTDIRNNGLRCSDKKISKNRRMIGIFNNFTQNQENVTDNTRQKNAQLTISHFFCNYYFLLKYTRAFPRKRNVAEI